jgi:hypothetical protein
MDLGDWLRSLGLEQHEAAFRENAIDDTVLPNLTAEDLKDLGVGFVGHRRKLLDAIAALRTRSDREKHRNAASSVRRRTSRRACRGLPSRTWSSSPRAREGFSAICSSYRTAGLA